MQSRFNPNVTVLASATICMLCGCSSPPPAEPTKAQSGSATETAAFDAFTPRFKPGESLAFEWSANGFEQLEARYKWMGTGKRDDVYQPNFSLSVPETDDIIWSSSCSTDGMVKTQLYFAPPQSMKGNRTSFKFETDKSAKTLAYPAKYIPTGQYEGFEIVQRANDPMFAEMKAGSWAYMQIGEGSYATKLRISLANASKSLAAFLSACAAVPAKRVAVSATPAAVTYVCKDGRTARATYLGNDTDTPIVRLKLGDSSYLLSQTVSGSGARYDNSGEKQSDKLRIWHNKGKGALFIESDWGDVDGHTETVVHCLES